MPIDPQVLKLRLLSGLPLETCTAALKDADGDAEKALQHLVDTGKLDVKNSRATIADRMLSAMSAASAMFKEESRRPPTPKPPKPKKQSFPPFPPLVNASGDLEGEDVFPSWAGFLDMRTESGVTQTGTGRLTVKVSCPDDVTSLAAPLPQQSAAYQYLKDHEQEITTAVLKEIFEHYPTVRSWSDDPDDPKMGTPKITTIEELKALIGPYQVDIRPIAKGGLSYVGFSFDCTWDEEHGLGVLIHKSRVLEVGQSDTSFDNEPAEQDGGE